MAKGSQTSSFLGKADEGFWGFGFQGLNLGGFTALGIYRSKLPRGFSFIFSHLSSLSLSRSLSLCLSLSLSGSGDWDFAFGVRILLIHACCCSAALENSIITYGLSVTPRLKASEHLERVSFTISAGIVHECVREYKSRSCVSTPVCVRACDCLSV